MHKGVFLWGSQTESDLMALAGPSLAVMKLPSGL